MSLKVLEKLFADNYIMKKAFQILIIVLLCFVAPSIFGQYILNPSLEGQEGDAVPPDNWQTDDVWSNPNLLTNYYNLYGDKVYFPVDGKIFDLLRARGRYYAETFFEPEQREYLYQQLENPLEANSCFTFSGYFCTNPDYSVADLYEPDKGYPLRFQVWGSNSPNSRDVLLVDTDPIANLDWEQYSYSFKTGDEELKYILIEVAWDTLDVKDEPYNGFVLVDKLSLIKSGETDTIATHTVYYHGDFQTTLTASGGESFWWKPEGYVVNPKSRQALISHFNDQYVVLIDPANGCGLTEIFNMIYNCDTVHPVIDTNTYDVYYRYTKPVNLIASKGLNYDWEPKINLSAYDIQNPAMLDYYSSYQVNIIDLFNCHYSEKFNVLINCDTLFPLKYMLVLDTMVQPNIPVSLNTRYPEFQTIWSPGDFLNCTDCPSPISTPTSSIQYTATLTDEFGCIHNENFNIEIDISVPNVITPNADGFNDCFRVYGIPENTSLSVFDKSNRLVYYKKEYGPDDCWDGTDMNGIILKADTYWYSFHHSTKNYIKRGFVLIVR